MKEQLPSNPLTKLIERVSTRIPASVTPSTRIEIHPSEWLLLVDAVTADEPKENYRPVDNPDGAGAHSTGGNDDRNNAGSIPARPYSSEPPSVVTTKHIDAALMALAWVDQYMSGGSIMLARQNLNIAISNLRGSHCETASGATVPPSAGLLFAMRDWIESAPHGDNCFLTDEYPGNTCVCGKESLSRSMDEAFGIDEPIAAKQPEPPSETHDELRAALKEYDESPAKGAYIAGVLAKTIRATLAMETNKRDTSRCIFCGCRECECPGPPHSTETKGIAP